MLEVCVTTPVDDPYASSVLVLLDDAEPRVESLEDELLGEFAAVPIEAGRWATKLMSSSRWLRVLGSLRTSGWSIAAHAVHTEDHAEGRRRVKTYLLERDDSSAAAPPHRTPERHQRLRAAPREIFDEQPPAKLPAAAPTIDVPSPRPDVPSPARAAAAPAPPRPPPQLSAALKTELSEAAPEAAPHKAPSELTTQLAEASVKFKAPAAPDVVVESAAGGAGRNLLETMREQQKKEAEDKQRRIDGMTPEDRAKYLAEEEAKDAHDKLKSKHANRLASTFKKSSSILGGGRGRGRGRGGGR